MWCTSCQQDVPIVAHAASQRMVCSRCQRPLAKGPPAHAARICDEGIALDETAAAVAAAAPPFRGDDWSSRRRVRNIGRELRRPAFAATNKSTSLPDAGRRFDPPHNLFDQTEQFTAPSAARITPQSTTSGRPRSRRTESGQMIAWLIVGAGTLGLAAGIGLIAGSLGTGQMIYWNLALGLALGGQGTLIFGLVLAVSRLWRSTRHAGQRLQEVQARLAQLQHSADALTGMRSGGAAAFYADLVRGASPQMLIANLKGQVDQLSVRLGRS
jgi:hypothetical protein